MSYESMFGLIEMGFVYSVALGIGIWQVVKMRREIARDRVAAAKEAALAHKPAVANSTESRDKAD